MLTFRSGTTRFVILLPGIVIKFSKCDWLRIIVRAFQIICARKAQSHIKKYHGNIRGAASFIVRGPRSNLRERIFWKEFGSHLVAPTYASFFGLVNIQARCERMHDDDPVWIRFVGQFSDEQINRCDIKAKNYGLFRGRLVCLDYANEATCAFLRSAADSSTHTGGEAVPKFSLAEI